MPRQAGPRRVGRRGARTAAWLFMGLAAPLAAQPMDDDQRLRSVLDLERPGYDSSPIRLGNILLSPELDLGVVYDNNVYAAPTDRTADIMFKLRPSLTARSDLGDLRWQLELVGEFRRYESTSVENSDSYAATGSVGASLDRNITATARASYRRAVENRSDPEVRQNPTGGPPLIDIMSGEIGVRLERGQLGLNLKGMAERYDFVSRLDDDRDFKSYRGTARILYQLSPVAHAFVQGFVNQRRFRLREAVTGANRNGRTIGALAGLQLDPGGKIRGDIAAGLFRYTAASARFNSFSGFAIEGSLVYSPRARTAILLDLFRGDVATARNGASGRIDTKARLGIQQEVRHNLLAQAAVRLRETHYRGVSDKLRTIGGDVEIEYLFNRYFSIALVGIASKRTGGQPRDRFERARVGLEIRTRL